MLVLSRKLAESVSISIDDIRIKVQVIEIRGDKVRLGFEAPESVRIHREEIQDIVDREARVNAIAQALHVQSKRDPEKPDS